MGSIGSDQEFKASLGLDSGFEANLELKRAHLKNNKTAGGQKLAVFKPQPPHSGSHAHLRIWGSGFPQNHRGAKVPKSPSPVVSPG